MGIYTRYTTAVLTLLLAIATASTAHAATLHPVPSIARALAAGPSGVMPSGLTVQRTQQLDLMLLKSNVELSLRNGAKVPVTRAASLSVGGLARGAVAVLKNSSPPKLIASAVIGGAISLIPGAQVREGQFVKQPATNTTITVWHLIAVGANGTYPTPQEACTQGGKYSSRVIRKNATHDPWDGEPLAGCWNSSLSALIGTVYASNLHCPHGDNGQGQCNSQPGALAPFSDADWDALEAAIPASNPAADDVRDFWFDLCSGNGACMGSYTSDPTLSGPSSVQGPKTTTTSTGPNGTTTTTTETHHDLDYSNPDGVVVRDRTTTTTTDPDGNTTTDTTIDTGPIVGTTPDEQPDLDGSFSDTPFPEVEPFYEQKYPEGLAGVWAARKAEFEDSAFMDFLGSFVPSFSGSCPAWSFNVNVASWASFGVHEFQSLCWVFDFIKVVMLVTAAFLCRALIFGG